VRYDHETVRKILQDCEQAGATDVHFKVPGRPRFRIDGRLIPSPYPELRPDDTHRIAQELLSQGRREVPLSTVNELEFSFGVHRVGRFRAYIYRQRGSLAIVVHRMAGSVPSLSDLEADVDVGVKAWEEPGLVLVCAQDRRLALMAALVDHYNHDRSGYLLTVERPLEYLHSDGSASVAQREVPHDTPTIASGLRFGLTGDVDAVVAADLPDAQSAELALQTAENGRRVVAAMVGCPWREAPRGFVRRFPESREREIQARLRRVLKYVVYEDGDRISVVQSGRRATD
jgi:twitching motility protein PilT